MCLDLARIWHDEVGNHGDEANRQTGFRQHQAATERTLSGPLRQSRRTNRQCPRDVHGTHRRGGWLANERRHVEAPETWAPPKARLELARRAADADRLPTFREYAEAWIASRRNGRGEPLRPTTRDRYLSALRVHIYPTLEDIPLDELTRAAVRAWHANLDASPSTKAHVYATLRTILNTAVLDDELLDKNPAYLRGAGAQPSRRQVQPATLEELAIMVAAMPERRRLLILLATWCALRSGELRELRRGDVVLGRDDRGEPFGWVHVRRGVVRASAGDTARGLAPLFMSGNPRPRRASARFPSQTSCCRLCVSISSNTPRPEKAVCSFRPSATPRPTCRRRPSTAEPPSWTATAMCAKQASAGEKPDDRPNERILTCMIFGIPAPPWPARRAPAWPN